MDTLGSGCRGRPDIEIHARDRLSGLPSCELDLVLLGSGCQGCPVNKLILALRHTHLNLF